MADLGLFGLMEDILEIYKIVPRTKGAAPPDEKKGKTPSQPKPLPRKAVKEPEVEVDQGPAVIELDPNKKYNFRAEYANGYLDPFSGTAPGQSKVDNSDKSKEEEEGDGGDDDFIIYFDMKTGTIGKIPRNVCASNSFIISNNEGGEEVMEGEIEDDDAKERLIWDMKKAMKNKKNTKEQKQQQAPIYVEKSSNNGEARVINRTNSSDALPTVRGKSSLKKNPPRPTRTKSAELTPTTRLGVVDYPASSKVEKRASKKDTPSKDGWSKPNERPAAVDTPVTKKVSGTAPNKRPSMEKKGHPSKPAAAEEPERPSMETKVSSRRSRSPGRRATIEKDLLSRRSKSPGALSMQKKLPSAKSSAEPLSPGRPAMENKLSSRRSKSPGRRPSVQIKVSSSEAPKERTSSPGRHVKPSDDGWSKPSAFAETRRKK
jgi:hypothetical protein